MNCTNHHAPLAPLAPLAPFAFLALCFCCGFPLLFCSVMFCRVSGLKIGRKLYIQIYLHIESQSPTTTQLPIQLDGPPAAPRKSNCRTPIKRTRRPHRVSPGGCPAALPPRTFAIGELIWGPARGHPAWPGKIVKMPDGVCTPSQQFDHVWVQWFGGGGRSTSELIPVNSLQSLSEGLEVHHKAQKDTRK